MRQKLAYIKRKGIESLRDEGLKTLTVKSARYFYRGAKKFVVKQMDQKTFKDILFINGCYLNHPSRYRVEHQKEQLEANNMSCDIVWYENLTPEHLKYYRGFVIFRCALTPEIKEFIKKGKEQNKTFFFDIDDLVIDETYVQQIDYVQKMNKNDLKMYMDGVNRNQETLKLCDYAITTTPALAEELRKFVPEVYINRNVASEEMAHLSDLALKEREKENVQNSQNVRIGYLSGSITHNPDFELIKPAIKRVLKENQNVILVIAGLLDLPEDLKEFSLQIEIKPFTDWRKLPATIASLDINLAPIEDTLFNRAKSENKWTESALVKVPTVASNVGAFAEVIIDKETGILCENTEESWYEALTLLVKDNQLRKEIGHNCWREVITTYITTYSGKNLQQYISSKLKRNIGFVVPGTVVRGGINVIVKHINVLREAGYDVFMISDDKPDDIVKTKDGEILVISRHKAKLTGFIDTMVASLYTTVQVVEEYPKCREKLYLVQNFETNFYEYGDPRKLAANSTYTNYQVKYITISKWCQNWLKDIFHKKSKYCPNGINTTLFSPRKRDWTGKIHILVEGNSTDEYKNVDETFKIIKKLDPDKFEVSYLSYDKGPKEWYKVDKFFNKVPYEEVVKIYQDCHILIKSSKVESFSYPPLEMMATGGIAVVGLNGGNAEYVQHEKNCMVYEIGNLEQAKNYVEEIVSNKVLREKLIKGGLETAKSREWENIREEILKLYE